MTSGGIETPDDVEVGEAGGELGEAVGAERAERQRDDQREHGVGEHEHEVQAGDLAVPGADRLHDPDLARLLGEDRRHGVDDEEARTRSAPARR